MHSLWNNWSQHFVRTVDDIFDMGERGPCLTGDKQIEHVTGGLVVDDLGVPTLTDLGVLIALQRSDGDGTTSSVSETVTASGTLQMRSGRRNARGDG